MSSHVIVDCQVLQTPTRYRGIGQFVYSLLSHVDSGTDRWTLVLNPRLPTLAPDDLAMLKRLGDVVEIELVTGSDELPYLQATTENQSRIDRALPRLTTPGERLVFVNPAPFLNTLTFPAFPSHGTVNVVIFYDLIPLLFADKYLRNPKSIKTHEWGQRLMDLVEADHIVTISQTSADDLTAHLGVDPSRITVIYGAGATRSHRQAVKPSFADELGDYVLLPSGDDFRKNNERAIRAFEAATADLDIKLVLTSKYRANARKRMERLSQKVFLPGVVSDEELMWLFDNARFVLFPTLYEGLGMPILEAAEHDVPVACSRIQVFSELSETAFHYFDPTSIDDMAQTISDLLHGRAAGVEEKIAEYPALLRRFSWDISAQLLAEGLARATAGESRRRLAVCFSDRLSSASARDWIVREHAELSRHFEITYFADAPAFVERPRFNLIATARHYLPIADFQRRVREFDHVLFHVVDDADASDLLLQALEHPGHVVLHDTRLDSLFDGATTRGTLPRARRDLEDALDRLAHTDTSRCLVTLVNNEHGVACPSSTIAEAAQKALVTNTPVITVDSASPAERAGQLVALLKR